MLERKLDYMVSPIIFTKKPPYDIFGDDRNDQCIVCKKNINSRNFIFRVSNSSYPEHTNWYYCCNEACITMAQLKAQNE